MARGSVICREGRTGRPSRRDRDHAAAARSLHRAPSTRKGKAKHPPPEARALPRATSSNPSIGVPPCRLRRPLVLMFPVYSCSYGVQRIISAAHPNDKQNKCVSHPPTEETHTCPRGGGMPSGTIHARLSAVVTAECRRLLQYDKKPRINKKRSRTQLPAGYGAAMAKGGRGGVFQAWGLFCRKDPRHGPPHPSPLP